MTIEILWFFFIYAFIGWCTEVVYAAVESGEFVNRGFLNGPLCPIYGAGIIFVVYLLHPVQNNILYMFIGSVLITSGIELVGGFALEKIFHHRWWDYSDMPFNIGGYICPQFALVWGLACLLIVDRIHPLTISIVGLIPMAASQIILVVLGTLFIVDLMATVNFIFKLNKNLEIIDEISLKIKEASDSMGENLANGAIALANKTADVEERLEAQKELLEADVSEIKHAQLQAMANRKQELAELSKTYRELLEATPLTHIRLLKAFPGLKSLEHNEALEKMKHAIRSGLRSAGTSTDNSERDETS